MKLNPTAIATVILTLFLGLVFSSTFVHLLTESWWFSAVGFGEVFWTRLWWQILIWIVSFIGYALFLWWNYSTALRFTRHRSFMFLSGTELAPYTETLVNVAAILTIVTVALTSASASTQFWEVILKYFHNTKFNVADPIFDRDLSFYLFQLPLYEAFTSWLLNLLIAALVLSLIIYWLKGQLNLQRYWQTFLTGEIKVHLSLLLSGLSVAIALSSWWQRYELLYSTEGLVYGVGYTDAHGRIFAYSIMSLIAFALGIIFLIAIWQQKITLPVYGIICSFVILVLVNGFYPWFLQNIIVEPNELEKEQPFLAHNIQFTRQAYGLEAIQSLDFPASDRLNKQKLQENDSTLSNVPLWDYRPLLDTYRQLQEIRLYYKFNDVDVGRYNFDGNYQQVMLSGRELSSQQLPAKAQTWVNQRLKYTHGYGLVMSPVNSITSDGLPEFFIKDIPPVSQTELKITRPEIYYGESTDNYIFTGTSTPEFDYPLGAENALTEYQGQGGVPMPSLWHRLAYAYDFNSLKILISNYFTSNSRIHYYREIRTRLEHVAPFLRFDSDPYMTLIDGKLYWLVDAYTVSDRYPYSESVDHSRGVQIILNQNQSQEITQGNVNYLRNSVKVLVDAYDGTMQFVVVDEQEPVLNTYRKIFPTLFTSAEEIPPEVKAHFRYPLGLFTVQAQMYLSYHMSQPQVFYNQEDLWRFPREIYEDSQQLMEPYYLIMRLPEASQEEFVLILPFTPVNKDNMIAWLAARSDGNNYGKLLLYEFPKQQLVYGPAQIEARIDQNPEISQQLTLWSQKGSQVIRGDLLVIPIENSLLYVEPIYLRAERGQLPQLKRVIVAYKQQVVMTKSLSESLAAIFGEQDRPEPTPVSVSETQDDSFPIDSINLAWELYQKSEQALRQGNWSEYGQYQQQLGDLLQQMRLNSAEPTE